MKIGDGVNIYVSGTKYLVTAEIREIDEQLQLLFVKGADFEGWIPFSQVHSNLAPGEFAFDSAMNINSGDFDEST